MTHERRRQSYDMIDTIVAWQDETAKRLRDQYGFSEYVSMCLAIRGTARGAGWLLELADQA
jgi:hypothetical protein